MKIINFVEIINYLICKHVKIPFQCLWYVEDILIQLGKSQWFFALDLQLGFWQIKMALEDMCKSRLITKFGLFDWTIMPFGMKNATCRSSMINLVHLKVVAMGKSKGVSKMCHF